MLNQNLEVIKSSKSKPTNQNFTTNMTSFAYKFVTDILAKCFSAVSPFTIKVGALCCQLAFSTSFKFQVYLVSKKITYNEHRLQIAS